MPKLNVNHAVVVLGLVLAWAVYAMFTKFGLPQRIALGGGILSILVVAIFWSAIGLGIDDDEED